MSSASNYLNPQVLANIKNLVVRARTVVEGALVGEHVSPFRGGSVEFAQHRAYCPGDELRYVDWRLFARTDHYHVKQFEVTTNLRAYVLVDGSGSMGYPEGDTVSKFKYSSMLASALAYLLIQQSDAVSLTMNQGDRLTYLPPRSQISYLKQIFQVMEDTQPSGDGDVIDLLQHAQDRITQRSMVIIFSDFFVDLDELMAKVKVLMTRGHDLMVFQILHPDELEFPFSKFYRFESMEDSSFLNADGHGIRSYYMEAMQQHQDALTSAMRQGGVDFTTISTEKPVERVLSLHLNHPVRSRKLRRLY